MKEKDTRCILKKNGKNCLIVVLVKDVDERKIISSKWEIILSRTYQLKEKVKSQPLYWCFKETSFAGIRNDGT